MYQIKLLMAPGLMNEIYFKMIGNDVTVILVAHSGQK
jgi:aspartate ammonia-lyase